MQRLMLKKGELESSIQELVERLDEEVENNANISAGRRKLEAELDHYKENLEDLRQQIDMVRLAVMPDHEKVIHSIKGVIVMIDEFMRPSGGTGEGTEGEGWPVPRG